MSQLCEVCNFCYVSHSREGKSVCSRCDFSFDLKSEPIRKCLIDGEDMVKVIASERVIVDKCPKCKGVWLDGHEVDLMRKAIEKDGMRKGRMSGALLALMFS